MKPHRIIISVLISFLVGMTASAQIGGLMNKIKKEVANRVLGTSGDVKDPSCATDDAILVYQFSKNEKIVMNEISFCHTNKGALLIQNKLSRDYYVVMDGTQTGPYKEDDPALAAFGYCYDSEDDSGDVTEKFRGFVFKEGNRYVIKFNGKTYGPYDEILSFTMNENQDKFVASVYEKLLKESDLGDMSKIEKEMNNAKTDEERMQIAMQISQKITAVMSEQQAISSAPQVVTNIPDVVWNPLMGTTNNRIKFNDIVVTSMNEIKDLQGNTLFSFNNLENNIYEKFWLSSDNKSWAGYNNGQIIFSNGKKIQEVFSPFLDLSDGNLFINYLYFSPVKEAIMKVRIPF
jgi:hypothetical protein